MLARLGHRAVSSTDDEDRAVHLGSTGDHVFDVVGVARAVNVRIVAIRRLIFDVCRRNRNTTFFFFGSLVDLIELHNRDARIVLRKNGRNGGRQGRLTVVNVTNRTNVYVWLRALKCFLGHSSPPPINGERNVPLRHQTKLPQSEAHSKNKLVTGFEPVTPSLPRKYSTC